MMETALLDAARAAPYATVTELTGGGDVLVLAPHPDDETLACGAAIAAAIEAGATVRVAIVTDGSRSHRASASYPPARLAAQRRSEVTEAVAILSDGRATPIWLGYPDLAAPEGEAAFAALATRLGDLATTSAIWTTWGGDPHPDHLRVWRLAEWLADRHGLPLWGCPVWGRVETTWTMPPALRRFAAGPWRARKARAVAAHVSQMTRLIEDDPEGFMMPPELAAHFIDTDEIFIRA
jgi:LmbE family N-acetylglucosaminyl deacetylase